MRGVVVGAGPAGIYATRALLSRYPDIHVDLLDRLPVPFGLVRYGVSPDHPSTKNAIAQFSAFLSANRDRVSFLGNVPAGPGTPLPHETLCRLYNVTVIATGAVAPRTLGPTSSSSSSSSPPLPPPPPGVLAAHDFARWVNGHPELPDRARAELETRLLAPHPVAVVGVGNVALDVARMLLRPAHDLADTDVSPRALKVLREARVRDVTLVGRKGPAGAAWTTAALREMVTKVPGVITTCSHRLVKEELEMPELARGTKRSLTVLAERTVDEGSLEIGRVEAAEGRQRILRLQFLRAPKQFDTVDAEKVRMELAFTRGGDPESRADYGAVFLSLGYEPGGGKGYRVGWANGKATGIIGDNKWDAESVVAAMPNMSNADAKPGLSEWLAHAGTEVVTWEGWQRIQQREREDGIALGRKTGIVKIESIASMLDAARGSALRQQQQ